jgi:hypothetical protein
MKFRLKSAPLQREPLLRGPRLVSPLQVFVFRPRATDSMWGSGQSSAQLNTGIPRISDLYYMSPFLPPQQLPIDSIRIGLGSTPLPSPAQNLLVIQSWTTWPQNLVMPQLQHVWGLSTSVSVDFAQNRPFSIVGHPPKRQQGAANRFHASSALLLIFQMLMDSDPCSAHYPDPGRRHVCPGIKAYI